MNTICLWTSSYTVATGDTLVIDGPIRAEFSKGLAIDGEVDIEPSAIFVAGGTTTIAGTLVEEGTFNVLGDVTVTTTGTVDVSGAVTLVGGSVTNNGLITVECGGGVDPVNGNAPVHADCTPPTAAPTQSPAANSNGWNNTDVTVDWNWTDAGGSGIDTNNCPTSLASTGQGVIGLGAMCKDLAGNVGAAQYTVEVDKTAPTASPTVTPGPNAHGWNNTAATINWNWTDTGSGIDPNNCTTSTPVSAEAISVVSASCSDLAGNTGDSTQTVSIDEHAPTDAPTVFPPANANGWINAAPTVTWNWSDSTSGVDPSNCDATTALAGEGADVAITGSCTDNAGNTGTDTVHANVDQTAPTLAPSVSPNPVLLRGTATASPNATDSLSGVDTSSCNPVDTSAPGPHTVACTATDRAGNPANVSVSYVVGYNVIHLAPAANTQFLTGSSIPVKFQLAGTGGTAISNTDAVLLPACSVTVTYPGRAAACATFNKTDHYFHATVSTPAKPRLGVPVSLVIRATVASTTVASKSLMVTPVPGLRVNDTAMKPTGSGFFEMPVTISLSATSAQAVTFSWATAPVSAKSPTDYIGTAGTATISAGTTSVVVYVRVRVKTAPVVNKVFDVFLSNVRHAIATRATGTVIIVGHH